jgi:4-amino-4-deoxy-L-arabinose transferase-like glycosyltransferase
VNLKFILLCVLLCGLTFISSLFVAGALQTHKWPARQFADLPGSGIRSDGWLEESATVELADLAPRGNFLELTFNPWRPAGASTAQLGVAVCGGPEQIVSITSKEPIRFSLRGACSPSVVSFRGLNPFVSGEERSGRRLSVQLERARVSSRLGIPIVVFSNLAPILGAIGVLLLFAVIAVGRVSSVSLLAGLGVLVAALVLVSCADVPAQRITPLWVFVLSLLAGMSVWSATREESEKPQYGGWLWILAPVALGAALRFYGIGFGLPSNFHPDEVPKVNALMRMYDQNTWNPQYFLHPSLLLYATYFSNTILQAIGVEGTFRETAFLAGRFVSAIAGTLSIGLTYIIGRRLFSRSVGLWSAILLAVFPLHVTCSRYLKEDALLTFIVLLCVTVTLVAVQSGKKWVLPLAGLLAGATAGTKYSGILMAIVPASAPWMVSRKVMPDWRWFPWAIFAVALSPIGFLATTPFALLDFAKFAKDFASESHHMQVGHTTAIDPWSQLWMYHFWRSIMPGMTSVAAIGGVIGAGFLLRRARLEDLFLLGLIALFYLPAEYVKAKPAPQPERYIVPCLPFLAIALAELLRVLSRRIPVKAGMGVLAAAFIAFPLTRTVDLAREVSNDTRKQLAQWMEENIPPGSTVLMDWKPYCPRFEEGKFNVVYIPRARIIPELDVKALKSSGGQYLVLSSLFYGRYFSQPESNPILRQRIREVFERVPVIKQVAPRAGTYGFHNPVLTLFSLDQQDFARLDEELMRKRLGEIGETSNEGRASAKW